MIELGYAKRDIIKPICEHSNEVLVRSAMEGSMGRAWVAKLDNPSFCIIKLGNYVYPLGVPPKGNRSMDLKSLINMECNHTYITPENDTWTVWLEDNLECTYRIVSRYAIKKDEHHFDTDKLKSYVAELPDIYTLKRIDKQVYKKALKEEWSEDFVKNFEDDKKFNEYGMGYVILDKSHKLLSGCSAYGVSEGMMEVSVATRKEFRRKGLARICAAAFILDCIDKKLYPNWDAANLQSVALAEQLGYVYDKEYRVFQIEMEDECE